MEDKSYIKLFRKLLKSLIWENEKALKIWLWCLLKATHIERDQLVGQQVVHLEKGQFVTGRKKASEELKMNDRTIYDYFKLLEKLQMISIKSNNKFSVVSIEKWEEYQVEELKEQQQTNNKSTTSQQQTNTNKNVKNIYLYLLKKYTRENKKSFSEFLKKSKAIKEDIYWKQLDEREQYQILKEI